jgi:hypothetical protein
VSKLSETLPKVQLELLGLAFQQDNVRVHTARATRDYLQQNSINVMNWPALSPDLTDATPYHDAWTAPKIPFHHAVVIISFSSPSP